MKQLSYLPLDVNKTSKDRRFRFDRRCQLAAAIAVRANRSPTETTLATRLRCRPAAPRRPQSALNAPRRNLIMFNEKLDLKLIGLVRDNTVLYDHNNPQYMDFNAREVIWQKIGDELKRPAAECKARWINIRDINRRILRKTASSSGKRVKLYKYNSELSFMRPFYRDILIQNGEVSWDDRNRECEIEDAPDDPDASDDCDDSNDEKHIRSQKAAKQKSGIKKKRKKKKFEEVEIVNPSGSVGEPSTTGLAEFDACDPVDSFLLSIGATLKTFSPYHLNVAKSKIFAIVQEHDLQQIVQKKGETEDKISLNMI